MANIFPFNKNKSMVGEDGVVWTNQIVNQTRSPLNFSNTDDSLNDTYATAVDENESQYLSVLESPENNFTLTGNAEQQVVIFNVEGCDEIYGIQLAEDDEGNIHKYQFQFRKTDDGQLEAMPETVQLLPNEEEQEDDVESTKELTDNTENQIIEEIFETPIYLEENIEHVESDTHLLLHESEENVEENVLENIYEEENVSSEAVDNNSMMVFIKREGIANKTQDANLDEQMLEEEEEDEETVINTKRELEHINIKEELLLDKNEKYQENECELESHESTVLENLNEDCISEADSYNTEEIHNENEETIITYQHFDAQDMEDYDDTETLDSHPIQIEKDQYNEVFIEEKYPDDQEIQQDKSDRATNNVLIVEKGSITPEIGDYEIVEGLPVTADGEINEDTSNYYQEPEVLYTEPDQFAEMHTKEKSLQKTTNILKQPTNVNKTTSTKKKILYYTVSNTDQKENLNSLSNPRSLLKNNLEKLANDENLKRIQREKLLERRYARSKEAIQAKMFHNFINRTTIPQAPIRQTRLPRKQEIKPVDARRNEEIIVKEVMVSSKGFIESVSERLKSLDKLEVTSIVELSDSDEDYGPKNGTKKKKKLKKTKITNNDTSDNSDGGSIIEIIQSDDELENVESVKYIRGRTKKYVEDKLKRIRGRPTKSGDEGSPQKKSRTEESSEVESDNGKKEITCPHCPKTFPSQNSLSTHIQHHNLENSLHSCKKIPPTEYKYKCDNCNESFKNSILLKRHICKFQQSKHLCNVCSKSFKDVVLFNIHKKTHVKENLVKATNTVTISPKKFLPRPSTSAFKAPVNPKPSFKCKECSKVCSTQNLLLIHEKTHKKFDCNNCNMTFPSKLLLDSHVRIRCVKKVAPTPKDKRLSFKIRRSYVHSPRTLKKSVSRQSNIIPTNAGSKSSTNINKPMDTLDVPSTSNNNSVLNTSKMSSSINQGLNTSSMIRTVDVEVRCDSCPKKFRSLTTMFKHKVKDHGLSTPDKKVFEPPKRLLHKPLNVHGGIPAPPGVNKAFQELRRKLLSYSDESEESKKQ
ncbi:unnamed protein product [Psylliodes chrysocephalus]|uniref:C2H2-type domain-containing protein n=1 Tax=Psylliodes chrysocephalus TaxID=3402493 RepID=A0A9P0DD44_9CUCU|nr:unnamed protein product [Psylliodes chrysocephala]